MHVQMGIIKTVAGMVYGWVDDLGHGDTLVRFLQTGINSLRRACRVDKCHLVNYIPSMAGWVADNCRALCLLTPWAYQCLAQDLFTYRPYVQPATLWTTWRQVECAAYLKSRGEPRGSRNVAQLKAVIEEWMTRPTGPPPLVVPPACRVDGPVMLQMIWHCHHMFKALFANTVNLHTARRCVQRFLSSVKLVDGALRPDVGKRKYVTAYNLVSLLRAVEQAAARQSMRYYQEGGGKTARGS
jgi:hypothetical protein